MSKVKRVKEDSLFKVKEENDECENIEVTEEINAQSGDSTHPNETTEYKESQVEAQKFIKTYKAKTPSDYTEVTNDTLIHYFGKKWKGENWDKFPGKTECNTIVSRRGSVAKTQLVWYNQIFDYVYINQNNLPLGNTLSSYVNNIAKIKNSYFSAMNDVNGIKTCLNNISTFKFSTENPMAILNSTDYVLANLEHMFVKVDGLYENLSTQFSRIIDYWDKMDFKSWDSLLSSAKERINEAWDSITSNLADLPGTLLNKFLNCAFVQNMMQLPLRVLGFIMMAVGTISTIRAPTSIKDVIMIFGILRKAVSQLKNAWQVIQDAINQVKQVANMIKNRNWFGMLGMLNTKGNGNGPPGFKLVEKPSSFAAKYPENSAYTTPGGHTIEIDNTKGHERLHIEHKSGTSFEMATDGDLLGKVRKNFQTMITGDCEISAQGNMHLHAAKKLELTFDELKFETAKGVNFTGSDITLMSGMTPGNFMTVGAYSTYIGSVQSTTVTSLMSTSITSMDMVDVAANGMIMLSAPWIVIDAARLDILTAMTSIETGSFVSMSGTVSVISSSSSNEILTWGANIIEGGVNIIGGI